MSFIELMGILAGALTTLGLIPQVVHIFTLKSAREISLLFAVLFLGGVSLWLLYGIWNGLLPVILWTGISVVLAALLVYGKLKYGR